jgi:flagellar hook protein FlgE
MGSAISIGQTGLVASSKQLEVIGNNLANSNTVGFKASSTLFTSMMNQGLSSTGALSVGQGVAVSSLPTQFSQGPVEYTSNVLDMAIDGEGFFIVNNITGAPLYTRAGAFHINSDNNLVDVRGYKVQGYSLLDDATGTVPTNILLEKARDATTTSKVSFGANLNESTAVGGQFEVSLNVYDSKGGSHTLSMIFEKSADGVWDVTGTFDGDDGVTISTGTVEFDDTGKLVVPADDATITIAPTDPDILKGATIGDAGVLDWNLTTDASRKLTGYSSDSSVRSLYADGYAAGELRSLSIDGKGIISGVYTNGQTLELAQIALANFQDQSALTKSGNYFLESTASGKPTVNKAGTGGLGDIQGNALEISNTDVSKEFISMITAQRAYQANAKVITTADNMLAELMNIKR